MFTEEPDSEGKKKRRSKGFDFHVNLPKFPSFSRKRGKSSTSEDDKEKEKEKEKEEVKEEEEKEPKEKKEEDLSDEEKKKRGLFRFLALSKDSAFRLLALIHRAFKIWSSNCFSDNKLHCRF